MELLTENPVYRASTGPGPGEVHHGLAEVRAAFERVLATESAFGTLPPCARAGNSRCLYVG